MSSHFNPNLEKEKSIGFLVHEVARLFRRRFEDEARIHGVTLPQWPELYVSLVLASLAGMALGLIISALSATSDQAISMVPLALVPQIRGAWEHEFDEDSNSIFGIPLGQRDEDVAVLGAGLGFYCQSGWNAVLDYEARLSSNIEGHYVSLKVGKQF